MNNTNLIVLKKQTDAIATNLGFYYQYLITLKTWLENFLTNEEVDIYCETEDDIFQKNKNANNVSFTQVKCYSDGFSFNSKEIMKSLLNFYMLHLKYENTYKGKYYFETNAGTKLNAGKFLREWEKNQDDKAYVLKNCKGETQKNLIAFTEKDINESIKNTKNKKLISHYINLKQDFVNKVNSNSFDDFICNIRWQFQGKETKIAVNDTIQEVNELINNISKLKIPQNLIFGRLLSEIIVKSTEENINNRLLNNNLLNTILSESFDTIQSKINNEVVVLMGTNFLILSELDLIKKSVDSSLDILKNTFSKGWSFEEFLKKYSDTAIDKLTRVDFFALNTPQGIMKSQKIRLDDIYIKPNFNVKKQKQNKQNVDLNLNYNDILINYSDLFKSKNHLVILGGPGAGKSILSKSIICNILRQQKSEFKSEEIFYFLPFRIELRKYITSKKENRDNIPKYIKRILEDEYLVTKISLEQIETIIETYPTLFVFDGLDEIFDTVNKNEVVEDIELFTNKFKKVKSIVTSRIVGYEEAKLNENFLEIHFLPFNDKQIEEYLNKWYNIHLPGQDNDKLRIEEINLFLNQKTQIDKELITNPLLLSLIVILFSNNLKIPNSKLAIYENCTNTLVDKWDNSKQLSIKINPDLLKYKETIFADLAYWQYIQTSNRIENEHSKALTHADAINTVYKTIVEKLKLTDDYSVANSWADSFLKYAQKRSLYFDNEFTHKTFREYYTAFWIYTNLDRKHKTKERDDIILKYISNPFWHIVLELLINMIDEKQPDNEIIDDLITYQITNSEDAYVFILNILPKIKHTSKTLIEKIIYNSILLALDKKNLINSENSLSTRISNSLELLSNDALFLQLIEKSINDIYNINIHEKEKMEMLYIFIKEFGLLFHRTLNKKVELGATLDFGVIKKNNPYLFVLSNFISNDLSFDFFIEYINLFGKENFFKGFSMLFHGVRFGEIIEWYLGWQFENIEHIEENLVKLFSLNISFDELIKYKIYGFQEQAHVIKTIEILPKIEDNEVKSLILYNLISVNEIVFHVKEKLKIDSLKQNLECNPYKDILEYLIFSHDSVENKVKRIENEINIKIDIELNKTHDMQ